eukprot:TRINITY_DN3720_c0_g1_i1.p1 TRINITY_DN3720_c0_g1~~TRINITY_DN3720_c0_g1_i1.p1  ORF type:complete len:442 (-),score=-20.61 TRINITY_DN3720_c0_g1_i1:136-1461(-)
MLLQPSKLDQTIKFKDIYGKLKSQSFFNNQIHSQQKIQNHYKPHDKTQYLFKQRDAIKVVQIVSIIQPMFNTTKVIDVSKIWILQLLKLQKFAYNSITESLSALGRRGFSLGVQFSKDTNTCTMPNICNQPKRKAKKVLKIKIYITYKTLVFKATHTLNNTVYLSRSHTDTDTLSQQTQLVPALTLLVHISTTIFFKVLCTYLYTCLYTYLTQTRNPFILVFHLAIKCRDPALELEQNNQYSINLQVSDQLNKNTTYHLILQFILVQVKLVWFSSLRPYQQMYINQINIHNICNFYQLPSYQTKEERKKKVHSLLRKRKQYISLLKFISQDIYLYIYSLSALQSNSKNLRKNLLLSKIIMFKRSPSQPSKNVNYLYNLMIVIIIVQNSKDRIYMVIIIHIQKLKNNYSTNNLHTWWAKKSLITKSTLNFVLKLNFREQLDQ